MGSHSEKAVRLTIRNRSSEQIDLVLEPAGEIYALPAGESRDVRYVGDSSPTLTIEYTQTEIKIWEEGPGVLEIQEP